MTGIQVDWYTDAFGVTGIQVDWYTNTMAYRWTGILYSFTALLFLLLIQLCHNLILFIYLGHRFTLFITFLSF